LDKEIKPRGFGLERLAELVKLLRGENGCPWDKKQTARSMAIQLLEETYELADAIADGNAESIREELGDVLFHIFFLARLFQEQGQFDINDVADGVTRKMIRRHPHVFGDKAAIISEDDVRAQWHNIKQSEKAKTPASSMLDSIPQSLPALMRAYRISERAAGEGGFDWADITGVLEKVEEEWDELKEAFQRHVTSEAGDHEAVQLEFGDLLFTLTNVARFLGIHPETALTASTAKFEMRFRRMEATIRRSNRDMTVVSEREKEDMWEKIKSSNGPSSAWPFVDGH